MGAWGFFLRNELSWRVTIWRKMLDLRSLRMRFLPPSETLPTLVGLVGIVDPPRPDIIGVIQVLRPAGVKVFMVTGDFKLNCSGYCSWMRNPRPLIADVTAIQRDYQRPEESSEVRQRLNRPTDHPSRSWKAPTCSNWTKISGNTWQNIMKSFSLE